MYRRYTEGVQEVYRRYTGGIKEDDDDDDDESRLKIT